MRLNQKEKKYLFFLFVYLKPFIFNNFQILDIIFNVLKLIMFMWVSLQWIKNINKLKRMEYPIIVISMASVILLSTILHRGDIVGAFSAFITMVGMTMFIQQFVGDFLSVIKSLEYLVELYGILNLISILIIGEHTYELTVYFLGSKNNFAALLPMFILVAMLFVMAYPAKKRRINIVFVSLFLGIVLTKSATALLELAVFFVLWRIKNKKRIRKVIDYWTFFGIYIIGNMLLLSDNFMNMFFMFLNRYLDKGATSMKVRFFFWKRALEIFNDHKILGIGKYTVDQWSKYWSGFEFKAQLHNNVVEFLIIGGIVLFTLYLIQCIYIGTSVRKERHNDIAYVVIISCFLMYMATLTSAYYESQFYLIFGIAAFIPEIMKTYEHNATSSLVKQNSAVSRDYKI